MEVKSEVEWSIQIWIINTSSLSRVQRYKWTFGIADCSLVS